MNVKIINPEQVKDLFVQWSKFAAICYDSTIKNPEAIGKHCLQSGHTSGSRSQYINFVVTDVPRFLIDQIVRHEEGVCKNVQSFRYVNKGYFAYEVPIEITDNDELISRYINHMNVTADLYNDIYDYILNVKMRPKERANEQARYVLPMASHSAVAIGFDVEAFIHLCNERLCVRTEDVHRNLVIMMRNEVLKLIPYIESYLVPNCQYLLWCPEKKGCGAYPSKEEIKTVLKNSKINLEE